LIRLNLSIDPADAGWAIARREHRLNRLGAGTLLMMAKAGLVLLGGVLALRLGELALRGAFLPDPLWQAPTPPEIGLALGMAVVILLHEVLQRLGMGPAIGNALRASGANGREPLAGPMTVLLTPEAVACEGVHWRSRGEAAQLQRLEETKDRLVLWMGLSVPLVLPRAQLTAEEIQAVRDWAAGVLARKRSGSQGA
jgi:hypothetical protein